MKTQMVCPTCRGLRSVANLAYPGHIEACPRCEASGYITVADSRAVSHTSASETVGANDVGRLQKLLKAKRDLLTSAAIALTSSSELSEFAILAGV